MQLSVIVPAYNVAEYIEKCMASVSACPRELLEIECLIVVDGSTDNTAEVVQKYSEKDKRIQLIIQDNAGVSAARNTGLEAAKGEYIAFLDADDCLTEDAWQRMADGIAKNKDYVAYSYHTWYEDGRKIPEYLDIEQDSEDMNQARSLMYASSQFNTCWGKLFRADMIKEHQIRFRRDLPIGEDYLFVAEYFSYSKSCYLSRACILDYLQRPTSAMRKYNLEQRIAFLKILYDSNVSFAEQYQDEELMRKMNTYYFRVVTNLMLEAAKINKGAALKADYSAALCDSCIDEIIKKTNQNELPNAMKKWEYWLLVGKRTGMAAAYFRLKQGKL